MKQSLLKFCIAIVLAIFSIERAGAACLKPDLAGKWINSDAASKELSSLEFLYNCGEKPIKAYDPLSAALWIAKARIQCPRIECTWGRAKVHRSKAGEMRIIYSNFSAIHNLNVIRENQFLKVEVHTKYRDQRRQSLNKTYYLHKQYSQ